jgi:hypothetical protein
MSYTLVSAIEKILKARFHLDINGSSVDQKKIAHCVVTMADFYQQNPFASTPWKESWCQIAQLAYYLPLNYLRTEAVLKRNRIEGLEGSEPRETLENRKPVDPLVTLKTLEHLKNSESLDSLLRKPLGDFSTLSWLRSGHICSLFDFGSGLSPVSWVLAQEAPSLPCYLFDQSPIPLDLLSAMGLKFQRVQSFSSAEKIYKNSQTLTSCSYVLTEIQKQRNWHWLLQCPHLLILEPSTGEDARALMRFRSLLIENHFYIHAPCPHQGPCSLLEHSQRDWCHDRTPTKKTEEKEMKSEAAEGMEEKKKHEKDGFGRENSGKESSGNKTLYNLNKALEPYLPFYNDTVTFSYLMASRTSFKASQPSPPKQVDPPELADSSKQIDSPEQTCSTKQTTSSGQILPESGNSSSFKPARLIGDTLFEKGKRKQAVCYGHNRCFLTWMDKDWIPKTIPILERGSLVYLPDSLPEENLKGDKRNLEIRLKY